MTSHYYDKTIIECKTIYTDYLLNILTPLIYCGFGELYNYSFITSKKYGKPEDINLDNGKPKVIEIFELILSDLYMWNDVMIEEETNKIKSKSECADIFDDLIKAVIKSHIIVLTYSPYKKISQIVKDKIYEQINIKTFIHKCYLECANIFIPHSMLFYHKYSEIDLKDNERRIFQLIKIGIKNAITKMLPMKEILIDFNRDDYQEDNLYAKIKKMLENDNGRKINGLSESTTNKYNDDAYYEDDENFESLVYNRKIDDTFEPTHEMIQEFTNSFKPKDDIQNENISNDVKPITNVAKENIQHGNGNISNDEKPITRVANENEDVKQNDNIDEDKRQNDEDKQNENIEEGKQEKDDIKEQNNEETKEEDAKAAKLFDEYISYHTKGRKSKISDIIFDK